MGLAAVLEKEGCRQREEGCGERVRELDHLINYSKAWVLFYSAQPQSQACFHLRTFVLAISFNWNILQTSANFTHLFQVLCSMVIYSVSVKLSLFSLFKIVMTCTHTHPHNSLSLTPSLFFFIALITIYILYTSFIHKS